MEIHAMQIGDLHPWDGNPRRDVGDVSELATSIIAVGILEPLIVSPDPEGGYVIIAGERRYAAARKAGLATVPAIVRQVSEQEAVWLALIENLQRADLTPLEEAAGFQRLVQLGLSQKELGKRVGRSQSHISKRLALLDLPDKARAAVDSGLITLEDATELAKLREHPDKVERILAELPPLDGANRWEIGYEVEATLAEMERAAAAAKLRAELEEKGVAVVAWDKAQSKSRSYRMVNGDYRRGFEPLERGRSHAARHRREPCHVATIEEGRAEVLELCTKPERHTAAGESKLKVEAKRPTAGRADSEQKRRERKLKEDRKARAECIGELLNRRVPKDDVVAFGAAALLSSLSADAARIACGWLALEGKKDRGSSHTHWRATLEAFAKELPAPKLLLVCALAAGEASISTWGTGREAAAYTAFLKDHGFKGAK